MDENIRQIVDSQRRHRRVRAFNEVAAGTVRRTFRVREVIDHGDYHHDQVTELPGLTLMHLREMLANSPYRYGAVEPLDTEKLVKLRRQLLLHQPAYIGWSSFELV